MKNLGQMMKHAQELQAKAQELQAKLETYEVSASSGGGLVEAVVDGKGYLKKLSIDPSLLKAEEKEIVEDLVVAAQNEARKKAQAHMQQEMQGLMGGLPIPPGLTNMF